MKAEILSIGTELLLGQIVNSDAQFLSRELSLMGIDTFHHVTVGDNMQRVMECLAQAFERSDIVITTGGLGPTQDDLTKEAVAKFFGLPMIRDEESLRYLTEQYKKMDREMTPNNLRQTDFPQGAIIMPNPRGTAPGCIVESNGKCIIVLPGPPYELMGMFEDQVAPYLRKKSGHQIVSKVLRVFGVGESAAEYMLRDLIESQTNPTIAPYASFGEMSLRLTVKCGLHEDAQALLLPLETEVRKRLGDAIYATGDETLEMAAAHALMAAGRTVATAESCTGGLVASMLIRVPGVSQSFLEGFVTYSNGAKIKRLQVPTETLDQYGAVSEQTAVAMARGARENAGSDIGIATTGIAGPDGGTEEKPVGLVYVALATKDSVEVKELHLNGNRERIRRMSAMHALDMLRRELNK